MSDLDNILKGLNKQYGKAIINQADKIIYPEVTRLSTGSPAIDYELGGGIPFGKVTMVIANESCGKTTLATHMIVQAQKLGKRAFFIDVEGTFDKEWAKLIGVDLSKLTIAIPDVGEQAVDILDAVVRSNECGIVILDSVAALMPAIELTKQMVDTDKNGNYEVNPEQIGDRAMMINRGVRKLTSALNEINELGERNQTAVVLLNQFRQKMTMYGNNEVIPGGLGIKFVSSIILELKRPITKGWITEVRNGEDVRIGQEIRFHSQKNKTFCPFRNGSTHLYFDGQMKGNIDTARDIFIYSEILQLIDVKGQWIVIDGKKLQGQDNAIKYLRENPKIQEKLDKEIRKVYFKSSEKEKN